MGGGREGSGDLGPPSPLCPSPGPKREEVRREYHSPLSGTTRLPWATSHLLLFSLQFGMWHSFSLSAEIAPTVSKVLLEGSSQFTNQRPLAPSCQGEGWSEGEKEDQALGLPVGSDP